MRGLRENGWECISEPANGFTGVWGLFLSFNLPPDQIRKFGKYVFSGLFAKSTCKPENSVLD